MAAEISPPAQANATPTHETLDSTETEPAPQPDAAPDPLQQPAPRLSPQDSVDFLLHPAELAKGRRAAENYLSSFRSEESRKMAEEALETLATVISGGKCDSVEFPWQQVRPYHGAAALTILKEKGAPARIEALRCRADTTRGYRVVPDSYPPRQVQKIRSTLTKVIEECCELGFVVEDATEGEHAAKSGAGRNGQAGAGKRAGGSAKRPSTTGKKASTRKKAAGPKGRLLGDGELRALVAASAADANAEGCRDAVFFALVYRGLKIAEITALTLESIRFSNKTGLCNIVARPSRGGGRGRRVELSNDELICLEDWLDFRGDDPGPLLCTLARNGRVEGKRLTTALLKTLCERRAQQAEVPAFTPNDLSRSADALTEHRKSARRKAARLAHDTLSTAEQVLYEGDRRDELSEQSEAIQFPFLGLSA